MPLTHVRGFKVLGAAIGDKSFSEELTANRVAKNLPLLEAIGDLPDPQSALHLLRSCASFGKIAFSIRTMPPDLHCDALRDFDDSVRACFEALSNLHPDSAQWLQATAAIHLGGLGLRQGLRHASGAHVSSLTTCVKACGDLDAAFPWETIRQDPAIIASVSHFNAQVADSKQIDLPIHSGKR